MIQQDTKGIGKEEGGEAAKKEARGAIQGDELVESAASFFPEVAHLLVKNKPHFPFEKTSILFRNTKPRMRGKGSRGDPESAHREGQGRRDVAVEKTRGSMSCTGSGQKGEKADLEGSKGVQGKNDAADLGDCKSYSPGLEETDRPLYSQTEEAEECPLELVKAVTEEEFAYSSAERIHAFLTTQTRDPAELGRLLGKQGLKAKIDAADEFGNRLLVWGVLYGAAVVHLLISAGADPNVQQEEHGSALCCASRCGLWESVRLLLSAGANPNSQNSDGFSSLLYAAEALHMEMVECLLYHGADPNLVEESEGQSVLFTVVKKGGLVRLVDLLIKSGADLTLRDKQGRTALDFAEERGNVRVADRIREERIKAPDDCWSREMIVEWDGLRSLIDCGAIAVWPLSLLRSLNAASVRLPRRQDVPTVAQELGLECTPLCTLSDSETIMRGHSHPVGSAFKLVAISYPWLSGEHPDPDGFRVRQVLQQLEQQWWAREDSPVEVFVFWDYLSLFQHPPTGRRTDEEETLFKKALSQMDFIYSNAHTSVIQSKQLPETAANPTKYDDRGWCWFESAVTTFKPSWQVYSDVHALEKQTNEEEGKEAKKGMDGEKVAELEESVQIPATPAEFDRAIDAKKFTNGKTDTEAVKKLYRNFLERVVSKVEIFVDGSWAETELDRQKMGAPESEKLADLLIYIAADPSLASKVQPQLLDFRKMPMGHAGLCRLLSACGLFGSVTDVMLDTESRGTPEDDEFNAAVGESMREIFKGDGPMPKKSALPVLAFFGLNEVVVRLLNRQGGSAADATQIQRRGQALRLASLAGHNEMVELLLDAQADVNFKGELGDTASPLHYAAEGGRKHTVALLIGKGGDVHAKNEVGETPLHVAAKEGHKETVACCVEKGATVDEKDELGRTPLQWAAEKGHKETIAVLLDKGANVNEKNQVGEIPLHLAARGGQKETVAFLVEKRANVNEKNQVGEIPLHLAARGGQKETVAFLVEKGANVKEKNQIGETPLHLAARIGHKETVAFLVEKGANVNEKNGEGNTPFDTAIQTSEENDLPACDTEGIHEVIAFFQTRKGV
uniref:Uncharacterized protein n=1 Tax=Chromera velia CCMP2878 TaxID=1169474 RepID=A0A0G4I6K2_9ALVE|eukprot:Cvel_11392.t1-p1 / transcript=Cvel_11392.t1 / gene=Cvel_11392 / organism=Chromera_velia_CCMP2878 / gene_product=Ankyrin-1, putative / transcript_product=Ankyrin-1, putative / location=Cvel_scaffold714:50504-58616(+) / protein_length=1073 / sequence_SO=supercontig / SO=protein_coding / is_pseudo=false